METFETLSMVLLFPNEVRGGILAAAVARGTEDAGVGSG
jgi:hypothetical protein